MEIAYIYGNMTHYDHGLGMLLKRTKSIFEELEVKTETVDLGALHLPYYDGETTRALDDVMESLKAADGIVLACTAQMFAPTALMQSFVEYLEHSKYFGVLKGKHCMLATLSREGGEKSALDYLARTVWHMGGFTAAQIGIQAWHLSEIDGKTGEFIDKTTEDFYRAVYKNRQYIIPMDSTVRVAPTAVQKPIVVEDVPAAKKPEQLSFTDIQEKEIEELSLLFSKKYFKKDTASEADESKPLTVDIPAKPLAPVKRTKELQTAQKLTQSLPKFFQPQLSAGLQAVIQINITGSETFDGYLYIHSTECTYNEGTLPAPDIIIMADTAIWLDVLKNKNTAQKAFMIGGIKVRGDFVLLAKFDTLFKFPES